MNIGQSIALELRLTNGYRDGWSHLDKHKDIGDAKILDILNGSEEVCTDMCDMPRVALLLEYELDPGMILTPSVECSVMDEAFHICYQDKDGQLYLRSGHYHEGRHHIGIGKWLTRYRLDEGWQQLEDETQVPVDFIAHFPIASEQATKELLTLLTWIRPEGLTVDSIEIPPELERAVECTTRVEIKRALEDTFGGSGCTHEHDCCGCVSTSVTLVHFHDDNRAWVHLERSRNY